MVKRIQKTPFDMLTPSTTSTLSPFNKPIATVKPGEEVEIETWDAFGGCVKTWTNVGRGHQRGG